MWQNELLTTEITRLPASATNSILRKSLAQEAMDDGNWVLYYESVLAKNRTNIENTPVVSEETKLAYSRALNRIHEKNTKSTLFKEVFSLRRPSIKKNKKNLINTSHSENYRLTSENIPYDKTSWGVPSSNVDKSSLCFQIRANEVLEAYNYNSYISYPELDIITKISTIVAGELWLAANGASNFEQAASLGPGALGSYANILARSVGAPTERMPIFDDIDTVSTPINANTIKLINSLQNWALTYINEKEWLLVLSNCVTDLTEHGVATSRVYEFSRKIEAYYNV